MTVHPNLDDVACEAAVRPRPDRKTRAVITREFRPNS